MLAGWCANIISRVSNVLLSLVVYLFTGVDANATVPRQCHL